MSDIVNEIYHNLTPIQAEIVKALEQLGGRSKYQESIIAKKIRENTKMDSKKKAGIGLLDLEKAVAYLEQAGSAFYAISVNSANDILIEKTDAPKEMNMESHMRRLRSEKSMSIFTSSDLTSVSQSEKSKHARAKEKTKAREAKRTVRKSINLNSDYEDEDF